MINEEQIKEELKAVLVPAVKRSIIDMNLLVDIAVEDGRANITLASTGLIPGARKWIESKVKEVIKNIPEVKKINIDYKDAQAKDINDIDNIIAVMSGKGGVGKSLVSSLLAVALNRQGYQVGILDADITGPSIPKMFGLKASPGGNESGILPVLSRSGIEIISINLLLPGEDDTVIWRGPLIGKVIKQFGEDVLWGKLDFLIVDLPPGTADAPLTLMQSFPISGVVIVFTPQDLVEMIVRKAVNMTQKMDNRILGIVENMSYLYITEIDKRIDVFGPSRGEDLARALQVPLLGQLPIDPNLARLCDEGNIESYNSDTINQMVQVFLKASKT